MTTSYATSEQALVGWPGAAKPAGADLARLQSYLPVAAEQLNKAAKRDWYRHPADEDDDPEVWYLAGSGKRLLHVHGGIVSLDEVAVRYSESLAYQVIDPAGYVLRGTDPYSDEPDAEGLPYFHLVLTSLTTHGIWPRGTQPVRLTGVRGYSEFPPDLIQSNIEKARQLYSADSSYSGSVIATDGMGNPVSTLPGLPASFWQFLKSENSRFMACYL